MAKRLLYIILILFVLFSCKKDEESQTFTTDLELVVTNQFGTPYKNARVFLYDDKAEFDIAATGGNQQAISIAVKETDDNGKVLFSGLDETVKYYFLAQYGNNTNQNTDFTLKNDLIKGSVTTAVIELTTTDSYIAFWTKDAQSLNVQVSFDDVLAGSLTTTRSTEPTDGDTLNALVVQVQPNESVKFKAIGENGCYWEEEVIVQKGILKPIELEACTNGSVIFYTKDVPSKDKITVTLSQTDIVGTIPSVTEVNKIPTPANPAGGLLVDRPAGTYIYKAVSPNCFWTGTITITNGSYVVEELKNCN